MDSLCRSRLQQLFLNASLSNRGAEELQDEYNKILLDSPYRETIWGTSSHEAMIKDEKCVVALKNLTLNRFSNILPFDSHLVGCSRGYLNCSRVTPLDRSYLIAQGPLPSTIETFWFTILEQEIDLIVNIAPFGQECADYVSQSPDVSVQVLSDKELGCIQVRRLLVDGRREVTHVQFDHWPNYSVPQDPLYLASVCKYVDSIKKSHPDILVNCSGGVGRSGTLVCILAVWDQLQQDCSKHIDSTDDSFRDRVIGLVKSAVETVRTQRHPWLVEGVGQYSLIFQVLDTMSRV